MKLSIYILFVVVLLSSVASAVKPPNFVVVYVDDLGWAETSVEMIKGRPDTLFETENVVHKPPG